MLVTPNSTTHFAKDQAGGKGYNLYLLTQAGLPIPSWLILGKKFFAEFIQEKGLASPLATVLKNLSAKTEGPEKTATQILSLFMEAGPTESLKNGISQILSHFGSEELLSVRSSAADEDSASHSFAGQLSSFLYVQGFEDLTKFVLQCWASAFSARSLSYRIENNLDFQKIRVAVIIQKMIDPEKSGVLFTCDPVKVSTLTYVVSSVYGVGEGLVSGTLDADTFWLDAKSGNVMKEEIAEKSEKMTRSSSGHCESTEIPADLKKSPSLSPGELAKLFDLGRQVQSFFNRPQDIEWALFRNKLYLLQARPVTGFQEELVGYPNLWDNSNIVESYGGLTSPLSFSFALRNYKNVYIQFCEVLGVPNEIIKDMDSYLSYMLGCLRGRVYYNLFNWYKLVGVLPGFQQNREFMETMMGVSEALSSEIEERIKPHPSWSTFRGRWRRMVTGLNFFKYHLTIQPMVDQFLLTFQEDYDRFRSLPMKQQRADQLIHIYQEMERNMMGRWKAPIINDFLCMVHFGLLRKLTLRWLHKFDSSIQNDLLTGEGGLESAEPTRALLRLAAEAHQIPELRTLILSTAPAIALETLNQSKFQDFYQGIVNYIDRFGFRCMSEMKLEEIDLMTDPSSLFVFLKNYLRQESIEVPDGSREQNMRELAEKKVKESLRWSQRLIYFWVLKHARKAVKNRENTRFARTRIYGLARLIFNHIGEDLAALQIIPQSRDVFWLTIEEIFAVFHGTLSSDNLQGLISVRKASYDTYAEDPDPRVMTRGPVYWFNPLNKSAVDSSDKERSWDLKGMPCCPGILEGRVKVVLSPNDNMELNGEILVTARTDPGWVPLYPSISGLLVERGSLLSHSAIVAREMGKPSIVSIPGLTKRLKTGMLIRMDGKAGTIVILEEIGTPLSKA